jgi:hypothetical protein
MGHVTANYLFEHAHGVGALGTATSDSRIMAKWQEIEDIEKAKLEHQYLNGQQPVTFRKDFLRLESLKTE